MAINYITNPSVETNLTGYTASGSATIARVSGDANATGLYALECVADAGLTWGFQGYFPTPSLAEVTLSFDVWTVSGATDWAVTCYGFDVADGFVEVLAAPTFTAGLKARRSATYTPSNAATVKLQFVVGRSTAAAGTIRLDAFRLAPGTDATWPSDTAARRIRQQFQLRPY